MLSIIIYTNEQVKSEREIVVVWRNIKMWRLHVPHFQGNITNYAKVLSEHEHPFTAFNTSFYFTLKVSSLPR